MEYPTSDYHSQHSWCTQALPPLVAPRKGNVHLIGMVQLLTYLSLLLVGKMIEFESVTIIAYINIYTSPPENYEFDANLSHSWLPTQNQLSVLVLAAILNYFLM